MIDWDKAGGAAFPVEEGVVCHDPGMTLRDYFAGQALAGLCASETEDDREVTIKQPALVYAEFAQQAYGLADAMLEAREVSND